MNVGQRLRGEKEGRSNWKKEERHGIGPDREMEIMSAGNAHNYQLIFIV